MSVEFWIGFIAALIVLGAVVLALWRTSRLPATGKDAAMARRSLEEQVRERDAQVGALQARVRELEGVVNALGSQLAAALNTIDDLKTKVHQLELERAGVTNGRQTFKPLRVRPLRPLLVVCGDDPNVIMGDLAALDGIGLRYTRLTDASEEDVANETNRAREDGRPYCWGLVTAHAGPEGVRLRGKIVPPDFWMRALTGFDVVGLSACKGTNLADHLSGRVRFVWYFREGVQADAAARFVQKFFQRLNGGEEAEAAFTSCLDAVPEVAPFADYRSKA